MFLTKNEIEMNLKLFSICLLLLMISINSHSQKASIVPDNFDVPDKFDTDSFKFRVLTTKYLEMDYDAVITSIDHLKGVFGPNSQWPQQDLTLQEDSTDLIWHENEYKNRSSFAYTVLNSDESQVIGCMYIFPTSKTNYDAIIICWVRSSVLKYGLDELLYKTTKDWIEKKWPFEQVAYPGREIKWSEWETMK